MRRLIYAVAALCVGLGFAACDDDPEDAVSKHVYGPDESPYLRTDTSATITVNAEFRKGHIADKTISLKDHAAKIQSHLFMTVDDMLAGLADGSVVFYNINATRGAWNKAPQNVSGGWGYSKAGLVSNIADGATVVLDKVDKQLVLSMPGDAAAGTSFTVNVGFAIDNGRDYDDYVRFTINMAVGDPGMVIQNVTVPTGDYAAYEVMFDDEATAKAIEACFGMTAEAFNKAVQDPEGDIAMYMVGADGSWIAKDSEGEDVEYTANGIGYWCDGDGNPMGWGDGCVFFVETHDGSVGVGRYPGVASGSVYHPHFVYVSKSDNSKFVEFVINATFE